MAEVRPFEKVLKESTVLKKDSEKAEANGEMWNWGGCAREGPWLDPP